MLFRSHVSALWKRGIIISGYLCGYADKEKRTCGMGLLDHQYPGAVPVCRMRAAVFCPGGSEDSIWRDFADMCHFNRLHRSRHQACLSENDGFGICLKDSALSWRDGDGDPIGLSGLYLEPEKEEGNQDPLKSYQHNKAGKKLGYNSRPSRLGFLEFQGSRCRYFCWCGGRSRIFKEKRFIKTR